MRKIFILLFLCLFVVGCKETKSEYELLRDEIKKDAYNCAVETGYNLSYSEWLKELETGTIVVKLSMDIDGKAMWKRNDSEEWIFMDSFVNILVEKSEKIQTVVREYFEKNQEHYDSDVINLEKWLEDTINNGHKYDPIN